MKPHPGHFELSPAPDGWRILRKGSGDFPEVIPDLEAAAERIAPGDALTLALPCRLVLVERLRLPTSETEELEGMVRLKLETTLPWPDQVTSDYSVVKRGETDSVVLVTALHTPSLDELCEPLRERQLMPTHVTLFASAAVAVCPKQGTVLLLYREQEQIVLAVVENGELGYVRTVDAADPQILAAELPPILLTAEMEGVPGDFSSVLLDTSCSELRWMGPLLGVPVETVSVANASIESSIDLLPPSWTLDRHQRQRSERLRTLATRVGVGLMATLLLAVAYIVWLQVRVNRIDRDLLRIRPELETVQAREARWQTLAPAIDPERYPVEVLFQIYRSLPSEEVRITQFSQQLGSFAVEGEAPSAAQAIQFADKLKENPELQNFTIDAGPPAILPNDHAKFRVFGK